VQDLQQDVHSLELAVQLVIVLHFVKDIVLAAAGILLTEALTVEKPTLEMP
jgi:hypothetical protein